jgi:hypothetical protein
MGVSELWLIIGVLLMSGGLVSAFRSSTTGAACSYMGVQSLRHSGYAIISADTLLFWAVAVLLVLFIGYYSRQEQVIPKEWKNFIVGGALLGVLVGLTIGRAEMIVGAALGATLGGVACSKLHRSGLNVRALRDAVVIVGLPAVVSMSILGLGVLGLLQK